MSKALPFKFVIVIAIIGGLYFSRMQETPIEKEKA
jgi:hypothetical protein